MPPVLKEREPIHEVLSQDPGVKGYDTCKYVFTDITFGISDRVSECEVEMGVVLFIQGLLSLLIDIS